MLNYPLTTEDKIRKLKRYQKWFPSLPKRRSAIDESKKDWSSHGAEISSFVTLIHNTNNTFYRNRHILNKNVWSLTW